MVLKKSNTPFNSGATQRRFNISRGEYRTINEPSEMLLSITLKRIPYLYDNNNPSPEHAKALEKIYNYLGYSGPSLKTFHESDTIDWEMAETSLSIPLINKELRFITERFHQLMKERNFLDGEEGFAEIRVRKVKKIADRETVHDKETRVLNPKVKEESKICSKRNKERLKGINRGLQRSHLLRMSREGNKNDNYDWQEEYFKKVVEIELQEEDQMDARVLGCRFDGYKDWKTLKLKSKSERRINGKTSYLYKMCSPFHRRKQTHTVLNSADVWGKDDHYLSDDPDDDVDEIVDNCEEYYNNRSLVKICDYMAVSNKSFGVEKTHKRRKNQENEHVSEEQFVKVNTASSQTTIRHAKGSFQLIARPSDIVENKESKIPHGDDFSIDLDEVDELHNDNYGNQNINSEKTEIPIKFDTFETDDSFIAINLKLPKDTQGTTMLSSDKFTVRLGNCLPMVFCVNFTKNDSSSENVWSLVGISSSDVSSNEDLSWEVTLKNTKSKSVHDNDKVKENFFCNLDMMNNRVLQFNELIQIALVSVQNSSSNNLGNEDSVPSPKFVTKDFKDKMSVVTYNNAPRPNVCSMEEALKKVQAGQPHDSQQLASPSLTKNRQIMIPSENVECDICFNACNMHGLKGSRLVTLLPCDHSFCYECWRSHIFYHTTTTSTEIRCMHTDCKEVLNETMMKALIPEKYLAQLYLQRQERRIDTSPLCQWCPKSKCNKVSMITERSRHVQDFGCCVVCDCKSSYCFSCQANPHWPMSCSQAAAYRNLLYKLGCEIPVDVTYNIELKPCPGCKYPIEKNEGCQFMECSICAYEFCWNCLQCSHVHSIWVCTDDGENNFSTYKLHTDVISNFPLKFFTNALGMKRKLKLIRRDSVQGWLNRLNYVDSRKIRLSFERSVKLEEKTMVKNRAVCLTTEIVSFLIDSYSFVEYFYILLSFAILNKEEKNGKELYLPTCRVVDRLILTTSRLDDLIVGKSLRQLLLSESTSQMFLENGRAMLEKLKNRVSSIQKNSRDVLAKPIGELDPKKYYRYK